VVHDQRDLGAAARFLVSFERGVVVEPVSPATMRAARPSLAFGWGARRS